MFKKTDDLVREVIPKECSLPACLSTPFLLVVTLIKRKPPPDAYTAPAHHLATIIMKFLVRLSVHIFLSPVCTLLSPVLNISCMLLLIWLLLALVVIAAAVDVFVLPLLLLLPHSLTSSWMDSACSQFNCLVFLLPLHLLP